MTTKQLGVLASGGGTTLQAILDAIDAGALSAEVALVISNNSRSGAAERARRQGIPFLHLSGKTHPVGLDAAIRDALRVHGVELVVLAGYMKRIGPLTLAGYPDAVVNTHPALLPAYGGQGMYGKRVHAAVLAAGESETGVTIHQVDAEYDRGPILAQAAVPVLPGDDVETLAARVQQRERALYVEVLQRLATA